MPAPLPGPIAVDASRLSPTGATIDRLARQELAARGVGRRILLRDASADLVRLISFAGLGCVLRVEVRREAEEREQPLGAQEEGQLPDPPV